MRTEQQIIILDEEEDRLAASYRVLGTLFPNATIWIKEWELTNAMKVIPNVMTSIERNKAAPRLIMMNILGIESGLVSELIARRDPLLTIIINSCFSRSQIKDTHGFNLDEHNVCSVPTDGSLTENCAKIPYNEEFVLL